VQASVSGLLLQVCMFGKALVSGLLLEECIFVKASVSGLLFQVCMVGKARVSGLLLEECVCVQASVSGLLLQVCMFCKASVSGLLLQQLSLICVQARMRMAPLYCMARYCREGTRLRTALSSMYRTACSFKYVCLGRNPSMDCSLQNVYCVYGGRAQYLDCSQNCNVS